MKKEQQHRHTNIFGITILTAHFLWKVKVEDIFQKARAEGKNIRLLIEKDQYIAKMTSRKMHKN